MLQPLLWPMTHADIRHSELFQLTNRAEWHAAFCQLNVDCTASWQAEACSQHARPFRLAPCPRQWVSVATPLSCSAIVALTGRHCATSCCLTQRCILIDEIFLGRHPHFAFDRPYHCAAVRARQIAACDAVLNHQPVLFLVSSAHLTRSPCDSASV